MVAEMSVDSDDEGDDVDEDEEMLQLKLQAVQAKLKLKKLQKAKKEGGEKERRTGSTSRADSLPTSPKKAHQASNARPRVRDEDIEVPLSPTKDRNPPTEPVSLHAEDLDSAMHQMRKRYLSSGPGMERRLSAWIQHDDRKPLPLFLKS